MPLFLIIAVRPEISRIHHYRAESDGFLSLSLCRNSSESARTRCLWQLQISGQKTGGQAFSLLAEHCWSPLRALMNRLCSIFARYYLQVQSLQGRSCQRLLLRGHCRALCGELLLSRGPNRQSGHCLEICQAMKLPCSCTTIHLTLQCLCILYLPVLQ